MSKTYKDLFRNFPDFKGIKTCRRETAERRTWGRLRKRKIKYVKPLAWPPLSQTIIFKKPP